MIKKEYMSPELEMIEMELQAPLMDLSTPGGEYDSSEVEDI
jgi:hypothetical protein